MKSDTPPLAIPATPWSFRQNLSSQDGIDAEILLLGPKAERELPASDRPRAFYVITGDVTITEERSNYMVSADNFHSATKGLPLAVRNHTGTAAKVLALTLPEPRIEWRHVIPGESIAPTL